jgi:histone-lysine N-methyltransferase SUV39H
VVPSPSRQLKKEIESAEWVTGSRPSTPELTGLSEKYYPTDAYENRARKGTYPAARKISHGGTSLSIGTPGPILLKRPDVHNQLCQTLKRKLSMIKGPSVRFAIADGPRLAHVTDNFEFINSYKLGKGVSPANPDFIGGCSCGEYCDPDRCPCLDKEQDSTDTIIPYQNAQDGADVLVLKPDFLKRTTMIYECGAKCGCDINCWNRVVQRGRTVRLEIFHTGNRGFGKLCLGSPPL